MDKNFSALKFLSQVFIIYGVTALLLNIFYYYYHNYHELIKPLRKNE